MPTPPQIPDAITVSLTHGFMAYTEKATDTGIREFRGSLRKFLKSTGVWMIYRRYPRGRGAVWISAWVAPYSTEPGL